MPPLRLPALRTIRWPGPWPLARALLLGLAAVGLLLFALIGLLSVTRGTPVTAVLTMGESELPAVDDTLFVRTINMYAGTTVQRGNRVEVLLNGEGTYPTFWRDLRSARRTITAQFYYSQPGAVADTLAAILAERRRAGVQVLLLLDAFGSQPLKGAWVQRLRDADVQVSWLRPLKWYTLHKADERSHVRAIVVDGRVGYTGGFGLADYWLGDGLLPDQWRETNVRFEGPAVAQLQATFATGWAEATGRLLTGDDFFPAAAFDSVAPTAAALLHTTPTAGSTAAERFMALTISGARRTLYVTNSYFVPDDDFRGLLTRAARRGVDVRVLVPGDASDVKTTLLAGRHRYGELLRGGVRVYEYQPTNMHAKTIVVDGLWSSIGSMNFDNRSFAFNDEATLVAHDRALGARMDSIFLADLEHAREITLAAHERRGWMDRAMEWGANLLSRVL
jgi:cardiolipin synthase